MPVVVGPRTRAQLARLARVWQQGQHIFITGPTGSGKTALARRVVDIRIRRKGTVVVLAMKPLADPTLLEDYKDFDRWTTWKRTPRSYENKILIWPDVSKAKGNRAGILAIQRPVFESVFDIINDSGHYTVQVDEGLYTVHPSFLGMADELAMSHAIGRSGRLTLVTLAQRPANLPLILYPSAAHAFIGRTREDADKKRLAEMGSREGSRILGARIADQGLHDFTWIPIAPDWPAESLNMAT